MTLDEFYEQLGETKSYIDWVHLPFTDSIRGLSKIGQKFFCPMTAVFNKKTGRFLEAGFAKECGGILELTPEDTRAIIHSSDGGTMYPEARAKLEEVLG